MPPVRPPSLDCCKLLSGAQGLVGGSEDHVLQQLGIVGVDRLGSRS